MIEDADAANAYLHFVHALCEMACNQKRISVQEREVENEKYASGLFSSSDLASSWKSTKWSGRFCLKILLGPLHLRMGKISKFK